MSIPTGWALTSLVCVDPTSNTTVSGAVATINLASSETVTCTYTNTKGQALTATKTANGSYDRTVTWTLTKSVDDDSHTGYADDSFESTWTVVADKTDSGPMNFVVAGTIEVYNPAAIAQTFTIDDVLNDLHGTEATVDCPSLTVDPLATVTAPTRLGLA